uniref:Uncharacterized protein n=1 Tax=virus sp. ctnRj46 TaxID=2826814 RepID=A0A8S5R815_9VIRU|nr:MAG TPA: hypothetical protein [virus sp. ctnRj46]
MSQKIPYLVIMVQQVDMLKAHIYIFRQIPIPSIPYTVKV